MSAPQHGAFERLIDSEIPVVVDFHAEWCGPCKAFAPQLDRFKADMGDSVRVVKIDVDKNPEISQKLKVQAMPTLMIFQNGELKHRQTGAPTIPQLKSLVEALQ